MAVPPAATEVVPPDDGGNGVPDESAAEAKARAERPKPKSSGNRKRRRHGR